MLFASFDFLLFFLPVLLGYWLLAKHHSLRLGMMVVASYFFYMASSKPSGGGLPTAWYFAGLLAGSTLLDYGAARLITRARREGKRGTQWFVLSLIGNLGLLGTFKYTGFFLDATRDVASLLGFSWVPPSVHLILPIGISFYTFQSLSYTIDVYRGRLDAETSFLRFCAFVAFFPQLVAGPIVRATEFLPQLRRHLSLDLESVNVALFRIAKGVLKKVLLGDFIAASFADIVFSTPSDYSSLENLLALYAFTLQIYADFSGYSDIAIGVARLFGITLPENFDRPYQAADAGEFWRRWHMTLSTWLRDYLFYPLGGSRVGGARAYVNLWITMFLVGMWHGASWNFVIYANLHAAAMLWNRWRRRREGSALRQVGESVFVVALFALLAWLLGTALDLGEERLVLVLLAVVTTAVFCALPLPDKAMWRPIHVFAMFHFTVLSRVFFRADNLERAKEMVSRILEMDGHGVRPGLFRMQVLAAALEPTHPLGPLLAAVAEHGILWVLVLGLGYHFLPASWTERPGRAAFQKAPALVVACCFALMFAVLSQLLSGPRANIYFSF